MNPETQRVLRSFSIPVVMGIAVPTLFFIFRFTAVAAFVVFLLLCIFFPLHGSRRTLHVAFAVFVVTIAIPIDIYVRGWNGPLRQSKHSGLRFVPVLYGLGAHPQKNNEAILGGCVVGIHDTRWRLVWD